MVHDGQESSDIESLMKDLAARPMIVSMAPEFRRCAVYVLMTLALIPFVARWVNRVRPAENRPDLRIGLVLNGLLDIGVVCVLRWRMRVDERGIARRRLAGWQLYSWGEFASGRVREGDLTGSYEFPERYPWDRTLSLALVREGERAAIQHLIRRVWIPPPEQDAPAIVAFRFPFRNTARIGPQGLTIGRRGREQHYDWANVRKVCIRRLERSRRDFSSLVLELPDRAFTLYINRQHGRATPGWLGMPGMPRPDPASITAVLQKYVPRDRIVITSLSEPPLTMPEWEDRLRILEPRRRDLLYLKYIFWSLSGLSMALILWPTTTSRGWLEGFVLVVFLASVFGACWGVVRHLEAEYRSRLEDLENQIPRRGRGLKSRIALTHTETGIE